MGYNTAPLCYSAFHYCNTHLKRFIVTWFQKFYSMTSWPIAIGLWQHIMGLEVERTHAEGGCSSHVWEEEEEVGEPPSGAFAQ